MPYDALQQMVSDAHAIVFFGGAGVSTESGIPDFRSVDPAGNHSFSHLLYEEAGSFLPFLPG